MNGVVREVTDEEILEHGAMVARWGFGCEPASAATVAGLRKLLDEQIISPSDQVVCILTGHELKDANATVKYHTGIDMKAAQTLSREEEPHGKLSNLRWSLRISWRRSSRGRAVIQRFSKVST